MNTSNAGGWTGLWNAGCRDDVKSDMKYSTAPVEGLAVAV